MGDLLEVRGLTKRFRGLKAVSEVGFAVPQGAIVALIGPNGAGKTTTFNLIAGVFPPDEGEVVLADRTITGLRPNRICAAGIGRTFQIVRPFQGMTVLGNVMVAAYGRHPATADAEHHAQEALRSIGMAHLAHLDAERLSVAEMRRLEIARAIATEPRLLLLDEMLAGLTATEAAALCDQIVALNARGITIVMVEHSVPVISRMCARSIVLNFGTLLAEGTTQDVLRDPRVQEAYLGSAA